MGHEQKETSKEGKDKGTKDEIDSGKKAEMDRHS